MHFSIQARTESRAFQALRTGLLVVGLALFAAGCGGAGVNGENGDDDGEGDDEDTTAPAAPSSLTGTSGDSTVELNWEGVDADDLAGYSVYRDTEPEVDASGDPLEGELSETSYTDESAENGTTYHYVVTAVDTAGNGSEASNEVERTPFSSPPDRP